MRHNLFSKVLALVLTLLVLIPNMGLSVLAAEDNQEPSSEPETNSFDVNGSKTASPDELNVENRETKVTLSLPSGEYQNMIDIVFVMDNSTSIANANLDLAEEVEKLFKGIVEGNPGIDLKVSVVKFRGYATDMLNKGLVLYDETTSSEILAAISNNTVPGSGSNIHSGLMLANKILEADKDVPNEKKYVILLSDGKSYIWNNDKGEPVQRYSQYLRGSASANAVVQNGGKPVATQQAGAYDKELGSDYYTSIPGVDREVYMFGTKNDATSAYYQALYDSTDEELTTVQKYDIPSYYSKYYSDVYSGAGSPMDGTVTITPKSEIKNYSDVFTSAYDKLYGNHYEFTPDEGSVWVGKSYLSFNPFNLTTNDAGETVFDLDSPNEDFFLWHADTMQKGIYTAGHYWREVIDANYNTASIMYYKSGDGTGFALVGSYICWMLENSDFSARLKTDDSSQVLALFEDIDNSIRYMVSEGVVTDEITDDFILKNPDNVNGFSMTRGGEDLTATFDAGIWSFDDGNYTVTYDADSKTITWTINVPIENLVPVTLSYDLILEDENADSALYPTNKSAVLDFVTTEGETGTFTFEIPKVAYVKNLDINVRKDWQDANDQDGKRPTKLSVQLLADGEVEESKDLTAESQWTATFSEKPEATVVRDAEGKLTGVTPIEYTVTEGSVTDYTPSTPVGSAEEGFVITNTHTPELIDIKIEKVWYDEDPSLRPASIKVDLLADGDPVESVELSEKTGWKAVFEGMPKYSNGEEIVYEVSESGIDVKTYWSLVSPSEDGFTITNTQVFDLSIKKIWDDEDDKDGVRPEEIFVTVLANDEPIGMAVLDEESGWEITFFGMPVFLNGEKLEYSVEEEEVEDYEEPEIIFEPDYGFIITNTHKVEEPPKTDDTTNQWFWAGMMVSSMALIAVIFYLKRRQDEE